MNFDNPKQPSKENNGGLKNPEIQDNLNKIDKDIVEIQKDIEKSLKDLEWFINDLKEHKEYLIQAEYENSLHENDPIWAEKNDVPFYTKESLEDTKKEIKKTENDIKKFKAGISQLILYKAGMQSVSDEFLELENQFKKLLLTIPPESLQ
jgi:soluble cytochrome b562